MSRVAVGIGLRDEYAIDLLAWPSQTDIDLLEVMIDDGLTAGPRRDTWRRLGARWPLVAHGTELGIANATGLDARYVDAVSRALRATHTRWYSEHLAFLSAGGRTLGHFAPAVVSDGMAQVLRENGKTLRRRYGGCLLLENPADILGWKSEAGGAALGASFAACLEAADAGALLDLTNLVLGARNDRYDPGDFISKLDLERVVQIHLAGGRFDGALWIDSHDHDVDEEALALLELVARRSPNLRAVVIERDDRLPSLSVLLDDVERARTALRRAGLS